jgi:adenine phosphoribosyltransferase
MSTDDALSLIREIPDFPAPGVLFRDLGPVFADATAFRALTDALSDGLPADVGALVAIEARGFLLGAHRVEYQLEYGTACLELPDGLLRPGQRVVIIDDVLATGGTAAAAAELVEAAGATVAGIAVVLELAALRGRQALAGRPVAVLRTV